MRDPDRIDKICEKLAELWHLAPDMRLGQLFCNLQTLANNDLYYVEDAELIDKLRVMLWSMEADD